MIPHTLSSEVSYRDLVDQRTCEIAKVFVVVRACNVSSEMLIIRSSVGTDLSSGQPIQIQRPISDERKFVRSLRAVFIFVIGESFVLCWRVYVEPPRCSVSIAFISTTVPRGVFRISYMAWRAGTPCGAFVIPQHPTGSSSYGWRFFLAWREPFSAVPSCRQRIWRKPFSTRWGFRRGVRKMLLR